MCVAGKISQMDRDDLKRSGSRLYQSLKFPNQSNYIVKDDAILTENKNNEREKYLVLNARNSFFKPLEFKSFLWGEGRGCP